jgi:hypothetical protein
MDFKIISSTDNKYLGRVFTANEISIEEAERLSGGLFEFEGFIMIRVDVVQFYNSNYIVEFEITGQ